MLLHLHEHRKRAGMPYGSASVINFRLATQALDFLDTNVCLQIIYSKIIV
jgi:hypothetical protein